MNYVLTLMLLFITFSVQAQDEYEKTEKQLPTEPIEKKSDSIDVSDKKKPEPELNEDNSKAFKGMSDFKRNIRIGGAFNLGSERFIDPNIPFDGQILGVGISPQLTYIMSDYFEGGLAISYNYTGSFGKINAHAFSAGPVLRAYPIPDIFLQVEGMGFYYTESIEARSSFKSVNFNAFLGGGIVSRFSQTAYMIFGVKINLMKNELTRNEIIPAAFTSLHFGLW
jgi:hypothetical protein